MREIIAKKFISCLPKNKSLIILVCVIGVVGISYGMIRDNDLVFIAGLLFVIAGYLLIRRDLKARIRNNP
jgi:hypothetical protein